MRDKKKGYTKRKRLIKENLLPFQQSLLSHGLRTVEVLLSDVVVFSLFPALACHISITNRTSLRAGKNPSIYSHTLKG